MLSKCNHRKAWDSLKMRNSELWGPNVTLRTKFQSIKILIEFGGLLKKSIQTATRRCEYVVYRNQAQAAPRQRRPFGGNTANCIPALHRAADGKVNTWPKTPSHLHGASPLVMETQVETKWSGGGRGNPGQGRWPAGGRATRGPAWGSRRH